MWLSRITWHGRLNNVAGDWIKFEHATPDKEEVDIIANYLGIDPDAVIGKLLRLWIWADQQTVDGNALRVTQAFLDRITFCAGFADALRKAGWLEGREGRLSIPNFARHNGQSAKKRAQAAKRAEKSRSRNAESATLAHQRREEKRSNNQPPPPISAPSAETGLVEVVDYLNSLGIMKTSCVKLASEAGCSTEHIRGLIEHYERHWREVGWSSGALVHRIENARPGMAIAEGWPPGEKAKAETLTPPVTTKRGEKRCRCPHCDKVKNHPFDGQQCQCAHCFNRFEVQA